MQPLLNYVKNFDATEEYIFHFTYLGSDRVMTNELSIREKKKNSSPVYTQQSTKFDKIHILSQGKLNNGKTYLAKVRVLHENNWSEWSPEVEFSCLKKPKIHFESIQDGKFVYNDDIMMTVRFSQEQGDRVENFQFVLMDQNRNPIEKFPTRKPLMGSPNILQERLKGLIKGKLYYVGVHVRTRMGIDFFDSHELIPHFIAPSLAGIVETVNQPEDGQILIQSYLKQTLGIQTRPEIKDVEGYVDPNHGYVYIDGEWVVIPKDRPLLYKGLGMAKSSDWIGKLWLKNIPNGVFLEFETTHKNGIGMKFIKYDDYIVCQKEFLNDYGDGIVSRHISNIVPELKNKEFYLYIKVIEYRVDIHIEVKQ